MSGDDDDELVLVCTCIDGNVAQAIRASLEARGIPVLVHGEHTHSMLGWLHGGIVQPRILVPRGQWPLARVLAEEIVGPLEGPDEEEIDEPARVQLREPADGYEEPAPAPERDEDDQDDETPEVRRKSIAIVLVLAIMGLAVGFAHIYARRTTTGVVLLVIAAAGLGAFMTGGEGWFVLPIVWAVDVVGGSIAVVAYNRRLAREGCGASERAVSR